MCGIVGYTGKKQASPILLEGLRRLEYRGYDSAGIAIVSGEKMHHDKALGQVKNLAELPARKGRTGIGHTRWATHGGVTIPNTHPHFDFKQKIAVVHNGIIENYAALRAELEATGIKFRSETDTEVIPHLIRHYLRDVPPLEAFRQAIMRLRGTWGIAVAMQGSEQLLLARNGSPLIIGIGKDESFIASDPSAISQHTRDIVYLEDGDIASVWPDRYEVFIPAGRVERHAETVPDTSDLGEKGEFPHFMLKEIWEQPVSMERCLAGRVVHDGAKLGGISLTPAQIASLGHISLVSCGTSHYASQVGMHALEELAGIRASAEIASELRYRTPQVDPNDLFVGVTQSGETADTIHAMRMARERGALTTGIVNAVGSTIARECGNGIYIHSGPEMSVASTKAFTSQVTALLLMSLYFGKSRGLSYEVRSHLAIALQQAPFLLQEWFSSDDYYKTLHIAKDISSARQVFFIGRGVSAAVACEGALKLKEVSYIPSFGYPAGEMKHGPISLIDSETPVIAVIPQDRWFEKTLSNVIEAKARGAKIIVITDTSDGTLASIADHIIKVPHLSHHLVTPLVTVVPLQLLAYETARLLDRDIDRPRNLAKSVTVE